MNTITKYKIPQIGVLAASATACLSMGVTGSWEASEFGDEDYPMSSEYTNYAGQVITTYRAINMEINADNSASLSVEYSLAYDGGTPEEGSYDYTGTYTSEGGNHNITFSGEDYDLEFVCTLEADDSLDCDAYVGDEQVSNGATFIRSGVKQ